MHSQLWLEDGASATLGQGLVQSGSAPNGLVFWEDPSGPDSLKAGAGPEEAARARSRMRALRRQGGAPRKQTSASELGVV